MLNAIGLANPGVDEVRREHLPWLAANLRRARTIVNVVGNAVEDFALVIAALDDAAGYGIAQGAAQRQGRGLSLGADPPRGRGGGAGPRAMRRQSVTLPTCRHRRNRSGAAVDAAGWAHARHRCRPS